MRLRNRWKRPFHVKKVVASKDSMGAVLSAYSPDAVEYRGNVQPVADTTVLEAYGAIERRFYAVYVDSAEGIEKLDGVCWDVEPTEPPNFEVVSILPWNHYTRLYIRGLV